jgi:glutathione S-transferase
MSPSRPNKPVLIRPPRSRPNIAKLLDGVTALTSVRGAYAQEGITDEIC